ncbi:MAG: hypothetical protein PHF86_13170 [Candidatus Nanoarchaeia archaeon]|nr:hypothetical protein [Candidatus Nanoarchaeia archaeon]
MKIRKGFVSNSSSSSYIITLDKNKADFLADMVTAYEYGAFNVNYIVENIKKTIKECEEPDQVSISFMAEHMQNRINDLKLLLEKIYDLTKIEDEDKNSRYYVCNTSVIELLLTEYYNVKIEELTKIINVSGWTPMHNSYNDMPEILKDIIIWYTFEDPKVILKTKQIEE